MLYNNISTSTNNNNNTKYTRKHAHHHNNVTHNNNMVTVTDRERTTTATLTALSSSPLNKSMADLYFSATEDDEEMLCSKCRFVSHSFYTPIPSRLGLSVCTQVSFEITKYFNEHLEVFPVSLSLWEKNIGKTNLSNSA